MMSSMVGGECDYAVNRDVNVFTEQRKNNEIVIC